MSAEEPLFCPFCGAEDFGCSCVLDDSNTAPIVFCETCCARLENNRCSECDTMMARHRVVNEQLEK